LTKLAVNYWPKLIVFVSVAVEVNLSYASLVNQQGRVIDAKYKESVLAAMDERLPHMTSDLTSNLKPYGEFQGSFGRSLCVYVCVVRGHDNLLFPL